MPVQSLTNSMTLLNKIEKNDDILIDFYSDRCPPCKKGAPIFEQYSNKHTNILFIKYNIDNLNAEEKETYGISSIPYLKRYKKGRLFKSATGLTEKVLNDILYK